MQTFFCETEPECSAVHLWDLCVSASANKQVVDLSEELARKVEDSLRQQEEISSLLAQMVDLQARCKGVRGGEGVALTSSALLEILYLFKSHLMLGAIRLLLGWAEPEFTALHFIFLKVV